MWPQTWVGGRRDGGDGGGVRPFLFSAQNSQFVTYSPPFGESGHLWYPRPVASNSRNLHMRASVRQ